MSFILLHGTMVSALFYNRTDLVFILLPYLHLFPCVSRFTVGVQGLCFLLESNLQPSLYTCFVLLHYVV